MAKGWQNQEIWRSLSPTQKAAAMALLEADTGGNYVQDATNVLGAIINRAQRERKDLGAHVSEAGTYQPLIEPAQLARLPRILKSPEFAQLTQKAEARLSGQEPDWVQGATHFLAPEKTMLALEAREPNKYKNWGPRGANWTGYDPQTGSYKGVVMRDGSHAFLQHPDIPGQPVDPQRGGSINGGFGVAPQGAANIAGPAQTQDTSKQQIPTQFTDFGGDMGKQTGHQLPQPDPVPPGAGGGGGGGGAFDPNAYFASQFDSQNQGGVGLSDILGVIQRGLSIAPKANAQLVQAPAPNSKVNASHLAAMVQKRSKFGRA